MNRQTWKQKRNAPRVMVLSSVVGMLSVATIAAPLNREPVPQWIWGDASENEQFFVSTFEAPANLAKAQLYATCDDQMTMWLNGKKIARSGTWHEPIQRDIAKDILTGSNRIAIRGKNTGHVAGLVLRLDLTLKNGETRPVVTDASWKVNHDPAEGWQNMDSDTSAWRAVTVVGKLGDGPWRIPNGISAPDAEQKTLKAAEGFEVERIYNVPKGEQGSWVCLAIDPKGRLITSDQGGQGLYRVTLKDGETPLVEKIPVNMSGAQGLVWAFDSLYVHQSGGGLFRIRDTNGDDQLDAIEALPGAKGGGEHGNHAVILTEDGESLYIVAGNHTRLPDAVSGARHANWQEDLLLPRRWDTHGHARGILAPGGWICRVTPDGKSYEVYSIGYRNQYDIALNRFGDMFTYDADMEWDIGAPWYRPTRVCLALSGSDLGWRSGTGKWPSYYEDSLPPIADIGPGSPTGVASGQGARFPARYQDAIYALDWTFGTIHALFLTPEGAGYKAEVAEFVSGVPLPVTDAVIGHDGAFYFTTGGRNMQSGLYRVKYVGKESVDPVRGNGPKKAAKARALRRRLEAFHGLENPDALHLIWPALASGDRWLRHAARVALEAQPLNTWRQNALTARNPQARITAAVAMARVGSEKDRDALLASLAMLQPSTLDKGQTLGLLRAYALIFIRLGEATATQKSDVARILNPLFPSAHEEVTTELIRLFVYLDAPGVVDKALALIRDRKPPEPPPWVSVLERNGGYGSPIRNMLNNPPPTREIDYAFMLRNVRFGWSLPQRREYITFINEAGKFPAGNSYAGFLRDMRSDALANCSDAERVSLSDLTGEKLSPELGFEVVTAAGPGRDWSTREAVDLMEAPASTPPDFKSGRNLFHAAACASCHRFDGNGGDIGPDLTAVRNRFSIEDLLESIIEPSKTISDQYSSSTLVLKDGTSYSGLVIRDDQAVTVHTSDPHAAPITVAPSDVTSMVDSSISQMPPKLINGLNPDELRHLIAYIMSRGNAQDPLYQRSSH